MLGAKSLSFFHVFQVFKKKLVGTDSNDVNSGNKKDVLKNRLNLYEYGVIRGPMTALKVFLYSLVSPIDDFLEY